MATPPGSNGIPVSTGSAATQAAVNAYFIQQGWAGQNFVPVNGTSFGPGFVTTTDGKVRF
jgi:hypothetical protein